MKWTKIEVYCGTTFIGSFYTSETTRREIDNAVDDEYGSDNWTKYNIG